MYLQQRVYVNYAIPFSLYRMQFPEIMLSKYKAGVEKGQELWDERTTPVPRKWAGHRKTDLIPVSVRMCLCKGRQVTI